MTTSDTVSDMARKTRDDLIAEARRAAATVRKRDEAAAEAREELARILKAARKASPPASTGELAEATDLTRARIAQITTS